MTKQQQIQHIETQWQSPRWAGIQRGYTAADVYTLRGSVHIEY